MALASKIYLTPKRSWIYIQVRLDIVLKKRVIIVSIVQCSVCSIGSNRRAHKSHWSFRNCKLITRHETDILGISFLMRIKRRRFLTGDMGLGYFGCSYCHFIYQEINFSQGILHNTARVLTCFRWTHYLFVFDASALKKIIILLSVVHRSLYSILSCLAILFFLSLNLSLIVIDFFFQRILLEYF